MVPFFPFPSLLYAHSDNGETVNDEALEQPHHLSSELVNSEYNKAVRQRRNRKEYIDAGGGQAPQASSYSGYNYPIMERLLPTQDMIVTSENVMGVYCAVFFSPAVLFGRVRSARTRRWRYKPVQQIGMIPSNTCTFVGNRYLQNGRAQLEKLAYGLAWAKQPSQDRRLLMRLWNVQAWTSRSTNTVSGYKVEIQCKAASNATYECVSKNCRENWA
jgi:hypothetical protein